MATADCPVTLVIAATVQVYFTPAGILSSAPFVFIKPSVGVTVNFSPEQIAVVFSPITTVSAGCTNTVSKTAVPVQLPLPGLLGVTE